MNINTRYTLTMEEYDEDTETCETICIVERTVQSENLQDLTTAFLHFLWNAGFTYVENVVVEKTDRHGNITETRAA